MNDASARSPGFTLVTAGPDLLDDADELVAEDAAGHHPGDAAVEHVQVAAADRGAGHPQHDVGGLLDGGAGHVGHLDASDVGKCQRAHQQLPWSSRVATGQLSCSAARRWVTRSRSELVDLALLAGLAAQPERQALRVVLGGAAADLDEAAQRLVDGGLQRRVPASQLSRRCRPG